MPLTRKQSEHACVKGHIQGHGSYAFLEVRKYNLRTMLPFNLTPLRHGCDWYIFKIYIRGQLWRKGWPHNYQEDQITNMQATTKKQKLTLLALMPKSESCLTFNHIPRYTNDIHKNNHKLQQNKHKTKLKWGRDWVSLFGRGGCAQLRYNPLINTLQSHKYQQLQPRPPQNSCSPLPQLHYSVKCIGTNSLSRNKNWQVGTRE